MSSFITFGCWNRWYCNPGPQLSNPLSNVIAKMDSYIHTLGKEPSFVCVAGDNYYPEVVGKGEDKKKYLSIPELRSGFECLSEFQKRHPRIPIDIIAGNHDIEGTKKMTVIPASTPATEPCIITKAEIESTMHHHNMNFTMFNYRIINNTLVIMLDSNIYCETLGDEELQCYTLLVDHTLSTLKLEKLHDGLPITDVDQLKTLQRAWLTRMYAAVKGHTIQNVVIAAHHPIAMYKVKNGCKFHTTSDEYLELCHSIYSNLQHMKTSSRLRFFYSCADLHTYQAGVVTLNAGGIPIIINQEIAGTGGTALEEDVASIHDVETGKCNFNHTSVILVSYVMTNIVHINGFLHWKIDSRSGNLTARFIATHEPKKEKSRSKRKSSSGRSSSGRSSSGRSSSGRSSSGRSSSGSGTKRRRQRTSKRGRRIRRSRSRH